jgi:HAD superfamily hydrolase (TIGR01509 family)
MNDVSDHVATMRPAAVLWDFDGTIVDTEPYWIEAETALIESHGHTWSHEQALQLVGNDLIVSAEVIIEQTGLSLSPPEIVEILLDGVVARLERGIPWRPGARELLADVRASGTRCGMVTMSYRRFVQPVIDALPEGTFDCVVTGEVVADGKPHPEPYLAAARLLGLEPGECIAIEDSPTGVRSALAAGCRVLGVPLHLPLAAEPGLVVAESLPTSVSALRELFGPAAGSPTVAATGR